jgi:hypothetical protein
MQAVISGHPHFGEQALSPHSLYLEPESLLNSYELAFEDESTGLQHRFACDADGEPLGTSSQLVRAIDNFRFVGMFRRGREIA